MNGMFRPRHVLRNKAGDADGGGGADRGDDFEPTGDDAVGSATPEPAPAPAQGLAAGAPAGATEGEAGEGEGEAGDAEGEAGEGDADRSKPGPKIPLARHKAMLDKARDREAALLRELDELKHSRTVTATNERIQELDAQLPELEKKYNEALADGRTEDATKLMRDIRKLERDTAELRSDLKVQAAEARAVEQVRFDTVVERIEAAYPRLDPQHEDYDEELVSEVLELQRGYVLQNYSPSKALQKAVSILLKPETGKQETATTATPRVTPEAAKAAAATTRKLAATTKAADAAARQPASMKVGMDSDRAGGGIDAKSFARLSQKQFAEIPEEQLARVRGDDL